MSLNWSCIWGLLAMSAFPICPNIFIMGIIFFI